MGRSRATPEALARLLRDEAIRKAYEKDPTLETRQLLAAKYRMSAQLVRRIVGGVCPARRRGGGA